MNPDDQPRSARNRVTVNAIIEAGVVEDPSISRQSLDESVGHGASVMIGMDKSDNQRQRADDMQLADDVRLNVPKPGCRFSAAVTVGMNHISRQRGRYTRCPDVVEQRARAVNDCRTIRQLTEKGAAVDIRVAEQNNLER